VSAFRRRADVVEADQIFRELPYPDVSALLTTTPFLSSAECEASSAKREAHLDPWRVRRVVIVRSMLLQQNHAMFSASVAQNLSSDE
jgi:hypothetical protein